MRVWGLGFGFRGFRFEVKGLGFRESNKGRVIKKKKTLTKDGPRLERVSVSCAARASWFLHTFTLTHTHSLSLSHTHTHTHTKHTHTHSHTHTHTQNTHTHTHTHTPGFPEWCRGIRSIETRGAAAARSSLRGYLYLFIYIYIYIYIYVYIYKCIYIYMYIAHAMWAAQMVNMFGKSRDRSSSNPHIPNPEP